MPGNKLDEEMMLLATFGLSDVEITFPDETTAVLTCRFTEGSSYNARHDTFVWARRGEEWQCVMHSQTPPPTTH